MSALEEALGSTVRLSRLAEADGLAMVCLTPPGYEPVRYGDVSVLGLLRRALLAGSEATGSVSMGDAAERLRGLLERHRCGPHWPFHRDGLATSIDSGMVLLGLSDPAAAAALDAFRDGDGGRYLPQRRGSMPDDPELRHWWQPDYAIECLIRHVQRAAGLESGVQLGDLEEEFERRSGMYFANPLLVDWLLALALEGDPDGGPLRRRLASDVLASRNPDGSFGGFDPMLSTALALLTLGTLGVATADESRERLAILWTTRAERAPSWPFYCTHLRQWSAGDPWALMSALLEDERGHLMRVNGEEHAACFYSDPEGVVEHALVALALLDPPPRAPLDVGEPGPAHDRYRCLRAADYITGHALVPYVGLAAAQPC